MGFRLAYLHWTSARFQGESYVWAFHWPIYIERWPGFKVKAMYGLSIGIFTLDFDHVSRWKPWLGFRLAYLQWNLTRFQGESHVWAFDWLIYIGLWPGFKVKAMFGLSIGLLTLDFGQVSRWKPCMIFRLAYLHWTLARFEGESNIFAFDWPVYIELWPDFKVITMYGLSTGLFTLDFR